MWFKGCSKQCQEAKLLDEGNVEQVRDDDLEKKDVKADDHYFLTKPSTIVNETEISVQISN